MKLLNISILVLLFISCKNNVDNKSIKSSKTINKQSNEQKINNRKINFNHSKFYLLSKDNSENYYLKKFYFENDMPVYKFNANEFIDKTGSAVMESLEYLIQNIDFKREHFFSLKIKRKMTDRVQTIQFEYEPSNGILYQKENKKTIKTFIDSLYINSIKSIYIPPCEEYQTDKYEIKDCLEEFVKVEEMKRVKNNDFNWYPRLDCEQYFEDSFCKKMSDIEHKN